jgi:hypothetical protein
MKIDNIEVRTDNSGVDLSAFLPNRIEGEMATFVEEDNLYAFLSLVNFRTYFLGEEIPTRYIW